MSLLVVLGVVAAVGMALALTVGAVAWLLVRHRAAARAVPPAEPARTPPAAQVAAPEPTGALVASSGPLAARLFSIADGGLTIGRQADNDIALPDEIMVSRHHAVISVEDGQHILHDRDSTNGTWVNAQRVFRHVLAPGDRIQIGGSEFVYAGPPGRQEAPDAAPQPASYRPGEMLDGYALEDLIGRGGMSEVYRARDERGDLVAVKILRQTDPYVVAKFVQEGNQVGPLLRGHPGIVAIYGFGTSRDGHLYIVMEYVDGVPLRRLMGGALPESQAVDIAGQISTALAFAHRRHIVHRDIKPENVLVAGGAIKVLDFGVAKLTSASTVTRDKIVGTPEYLSPEQARGDPVLPASDVYSLGVVLYEMLTGTVPFFRPESEDPTRAALEVVRRHLEEQPKPVRERNPAVSVSPGVEAVVMRTLAKKCEDRYRTGRELAEALGTRQPVIEPAALTTDRPAARLVIARGPRQGRDILVPESGVSIGRADLDPNDPMISRQHATISFEEGCYWLRDTSRNGTWIDNRRVYGQVPLRPGAAITIGSSTLSLIEPAPPQ